MRTKRTTEGAETSDRPWEKLKTRESLDFTEQGAPRGGRGLVSTNVHRGEGLKGPRSGKRVDCSEGKSYWCLRCSWKPNHFGVDTMPGERSGRFRKERFAFVEGF